MNDKFESSLLESGELMKRGTMAIVNNAGRVVAIITVIISALVLFTDIKFADFGAESFTSTLAIMLISSYLMYFSMSDAGENAAEECEEYKRAAERYKKLTACVSGDKIAQLREFCKSYSLEELKYRRENLLMKYGYGIDEYNSYKQSMPCDKRSEHVFRQADRLKSVSLTPKMLLSHDSTRERSELANPERFRFMSMIFRLIPSMICMTVTVSVILTAKDGLNAEAVADGVFKLASLLLIGLKGYVSGYDYKKHKITLWLETKARLLDAFLKASNISA